MKFLLILLLLIPIITKKDQVLSKAVKRNTATQEGLSPTNADVKKRVVHWPYWNLLQGWNEPKGDPQLQIGNAIFLQNSLTLQKNVQGDVQNDGRVKILKVNFRHPKKTEKKINEYVKNKTEGKIKNLVKNFSKNTNIVLINHVVFKGKWQKPFHPDNTTVEKFFVDENTTVDVPMLHLTGPFNTYHDTDLPCTVVELPYRNNISMIIVLAEPDKIYELEQGMSAETIQRWRTLSTEMPIQLSIPKFSVDSTMDTENPLHKLGIKSAFTDSADFSGITHNVDLKAGKVFHRVKITVDEEGTEAAWTTVLEAVPTQTHHRAKRSVDEKRTEATEATLLGDGALKLFPLEEFIRLFLIVFYNKGTEEPLLIDKFGIPEKK